MGLKRMFLSGTSSRATTVSVAAADPPLTMPPRAAMALAFFGAAPPLALAERCLLRIASVAV